MTNWIKHDGTNPDWPTGLRPDDLVIPRYQETQYLDTAICAGNVDWDQVQDYQIVHLQPTAWRQIWRTIKGWFSA